MKTKMLVALIAIASVVILTSCKPRMSGQIVANWVKPNKNLLMVNGRLYNTSDSKLWGSPIELADGLPTLANNGHPMRYEVVAERIGKDIVVCDFDAITYWFETYTAAQQDEFRQTIKNIVVYHYPNPEKLVTGAAISCRCMRVDNYIQNGISLEAYDCGVQSTELVPEIKGAVVKVGGVQILLVDAKEVDAFLQKKKVESDQQSARITVDMEKFQSELDTNQLEYEDARKVASQSYTNDLQYMAAIKESADAIKTAQTMANAINYLRSKYGEPPDMTRQTIQFHLGNHLEFPNTIYQHYPKEQWDAWVAEVADAVRIQSIRQAANRIDNEIDSLPQKIQNQRNWQIKTATAALDAVKKKLDDANKNLKTVQSPSFYLSDFSPAALEIIQTDAEGKFTVHNPKAGTKVFAKIKSDETGEEFFWLMDLSQKGEKLILSDNTLFTVINKSP